MAHTVSLLTDFGLQDSYVAEVKAVLLGVPALRVVDICHEVPAYNVRVGAFQLFRSFSFFPKGTLHLAIVDPGVGTHRKAIYVEAGRFKFVGPDNGLLAWAVRAEEAASGKKAKVFEIPVPDDSSATFHGRDVFAPFVVRVLTGKKVVKHKVEAFQGAGFPSFSAGPGSEAEVVLSDRFGNVVTSIPLAVAAPSLRVGGVRLNSYANYAAIPAGRAGLIAGSHGFWEISCNRGSAADLLRLSVGDKLEVGTS